jgi:hypothetical protein
MASSVLGSAYSRTAAILLCILPPGLQYAPPDPNLTLAYKQHPATSGKAGNRKLLIYGEFANLCNTPQRQTAHS